MTNSREYQSIKSIRGKISLSLEENIRSKQGRDININISNISEGKFSQLNKGVKDMKKERKAQVKVKNLTGVKNALLKHRKVWLTVDDQTWIYAEYNGKTVWINFGMDSETASLYVALTRIYDFLSFKRSIDALGQ